MVFDGYKSSTKDEEHFRRCVKTVGTAIVEFDEITPVVAMKFLSNVQNKESFIRLLTKHFVASGITVSQAIADADTMIVAQAIERGMKGEIFAIAGEDTDLLVLMIALASDTVEINTLIPNSMRKEDRIYSTLLLAN